jgi:hypothetical protein
VSIKCEFCTVNCGNKWCDFNVNCEIELINKASALKHRKGINMTETKSLRYFEDTNIFLDFEKVDAIVCNPGNSVVYDYKISMSNGVLLDYRGDGLLTQFKNYIKTKEL